MNDEDSQVIKTREALRKAIAAMFDGWEDSWKTGGYGAMGGFREFITTNYPKATTDAPLPDDKESNDE